MSYSCWYFLVQNLFPLYINSINPSSEIDPTKLMNPEKGTEIAACWKEFYPEIRSILKKTTAKSMPKIYIQKNF
jgi:hypothetical protein